jgi:hypothetical protein
MTFTFKSSLFGALLVFTFLNAGAQDFDGYAIYNSANSSTTYLIDSEGDIAHSWSCPTVANYALALKSDGNLVRGAVYNGNQIDGAAVGGMVQELDPDANVVWQFIYSSSTYVAHHDICLMPNGHVLLIAWELVGQAEVQSLGYEDNGDKYSTHIIEVAQDGSDGEIVWEWHIKDHFVQDVDAELSNYGVISEHPELLNINVETDAFGGFGGPDDWFHVNGIDYNESLDQIVFSSRHLSEIFVIDHSTSSEEAAGHTGGNSGMGGDFLYRWGHPSNYDVSGAQIIPAATHDARWIADDRPNGGFIQIFNNEGNNGNSTVDAIDAPVNGYTYDHTPGQAYEPTSYSWRHNCVANASGQSSSDRMSNGNIYVNLAGGMGGAGYMYEATEDGDVIWQYNAGTNKGFRYECDYPGIQALLTNPCDNGSSVDKLEKLNITVFPNPSTGLFSLIGEFGPAGPEWIVVTDMMGNEILSEQYVLNLDLSDQAAGLYTITVIDGAYKNTKLLSVIR